MHPRRRKEACFDGYWVVEVNWFDWSADFYRSILFVRFSQRGTWKFYRLFYCFLFSPQREGCMGVEFCGPLFRCIYDARLCDTCVILANSMADERLGWLLLQRWYD